MVSDGNRIDGIRKILGGGNGGIGHVCGGLGCDSHVVLVVLYKLEGGGVYDSSSSGAAELALIS